MIAISLLVLFYASYLVKMFLLRRQNIAGDILGKGRKPKRQVFLEVVLKCITYLGAVAQFTSVLWGDAMFGLLAVPILREIGLCFMLLGVILLILAVVVMRGNWRAGYSEDQNTDLVTTGVYQYSRNPAFLGFDLLYIGCTFSFPTVINAAFAIAAVLVFHLQILSEEKFLASAFGQQYSDYSAVTMRYFGRKKRG
jgi:protein-S-isoprenylcysteine O-methyltransferase Ste14